MNSDLKAIHKMLLAQHSALTKKLGKETDPAAAQAIVTEMREILHRIDLAQSLLFKASSEALTTRVAKVKQANSKLAKAIAVAKKATAIIKAVGDFLTVVDTALDLAKTL